MVNTGDGLLYFFNLMIFYFGAEAPVFGIIFMLFLGGGFLHTRRLLDPADKRGRRWFSRVRYLAAHTSELGVATSWTYSQLLSLFVSYSSVFKSFVLFYLFFWFTLYLGVSRTLFLYGVVLAVAYFYLHSSAWDPFRSYQRLYSTRLDPLDPRPGVFFPNRRGWYLTSVSDLFNFSGDQLGGHLYYSSSQRSRFGLEEYPNKYGVVFLKDPVYFSRFLYYYVELYIYSSIHKYWGRSVGRDNFCMAVEFDSRLANLLTTAFYPSYFLPVAECAHLSSVPAPSYFFSRSLIYTTRAVLARRIINRELDSSMTYAYRLRDLSFDISIDTGPDRFEVAWYKISGAEKLNKLLASIITEQGRINHLVQYIYASYFFRFDYSSPYIKFQERLKHVFFKLFPPSYYIRWLTFFLSFNFSRITYSLISKSFLLPTDWFGWSALYYFERWAGRTKLGLMLSRFATGFDFFNTVHVLKRGRFEFVLDATLYPVNRFKKYYYFDGASQFPLHRSFNFLNRLLGVSMLRPLRVILDRVRARRIASAPLTLWDYDAVPVRETWYSGDGLEPFLDADQAFLLDDLSFLSDLRPLPPAHVLVDNDSANSTRSLESEDLLRLHPILSWVSSHFDEIAASKALRFLLSTDSNVLTLKELFQSNPSYESYIKNIFYRGQSSRFYGWFCGSFSHRSVFPFYDLSFRILIRSSLFSDLDVDTVPNYNSYASACESNLSVSYVFRRFKPNRVDYFVPWLSLADSEGRINSPSFFKKRFRGKRLCLVKASASRLVRLLRLKLSMWNMFKAGFGRYPLFFSRRIRSALRLVFRDPFLFYSSRCTPSPGVNFRRFLWSSIFRSPVLAFLSRHVSLSDRSVDGLFVSYLFAQLSEPLEARFGFTSAYVRWLFFNWRQLGKYMFNRYMSDECTRVEYDFWCSVECNPFEVSAWIRFFDYLFSDTRFFLYSNITINGFDNSFGFGSCVPNVLGTLHRLRDFRNEVILKIPTNYFNLLMSGEPSMFNRWDWKAFVSVSSSWVSTILSSICSDGREADYTLFQSYSRVFSFFNKAIPNLFPRDETELLKPGVYKSRYGYHNRSTIRMHRAVRDQSWRLAVPSETSFEVINRIFYHYCSIGRGHEFNSPTVTSFLSGFSEFLGASWSIDNQFRLLSNVFILEPYLNIYRSGETALTRSDFLCYVLNDRVLFKSVVDFFLNEFRFLNEGCPHSRVLSFDLFYGLSDVDLDSYLSPALSRGNGFSEDRQFQFDIFELEKPVRAGSRKQNRDYFSTAGTPDGVFFDPSIPFLKTTVFQRRTTSSWYYSFSLPRPEFYHERVSLISNSVDGFTFVHLGRIDILIRALPVSLWSHVAFFTYKRVVSLFQQYVCVLKNLLRGRIDPLQL